MAIDTDVLIIGGGIAGASLGAALATKRRVVIAEAEDQPGLHATGRSAAFWHEGYGGPGVAPLTRASRTVLADPPPDLSDRSFLTSRGAIHIARAGEAFDLVEGVSATPLDRAALEERLPGLRPAWTSGLDEPGLADIHVAGLHAAYLAQVRRRGGQVAAGKRLKQAKRVGDAWHVTFEDGADHRAAVLVDAAGAWADDVASRCDVAPLGILPKRRTMVQLRVGRSGIARLPLIVAADASFYFKGEGERSLWLSPHDEIDTGPCDAAPEEMDIAVAIDRFQQVVDWPVERVERSWAGLRSFASDRLPVFGFDPDADGFFWCAGQGGFGIQTAPAAAAICATLILGEDAPLAAGLDGSLYDPRRLRMGQAAR